MEDRIKFRVDVFTGENHEKAFFETEARARQYAEMAWSEDSNVFILKRLYDDWYDPIDMV